MLGAGTTLGVVAMTRRALAVAARARVPLAPRGRLGPPGHPPRRAALGLGRSSTSPRTRLAYLVIIVLAGGIGVARFQIYAHGVHHLPAAPLDLRRLDLHRVAAGDGRAVERRRPRRGARALLARAARHDRRDRAGRPRHSSRSPSRSRRSCSSTGAATAEDIPADRSHAAGFRGRTSVLLGVPADHAHVLRDPGQPDPGPRQRRGGGRHRRGRHRCSCAASDGTSRRSRSGMRPPTRSRPPWASRCSARGSARSTAQRIGGTSRGPCPRRS